MRRKAVHADRDRDRGPPGRDLLEHLQVHLVGLAAAAPLLRLRQAQQPGRTELGEHSLGVGLRLLVRVDDRVEHLVADVAGERDQFNGVFGRKQAIDRHGSTVNRAAGDDAGAAVGTTGIGAAVTSSPASRARARRHTSPSGNDRPQGRLDRSRYPGEALLTADFGTPWNDARQTFSATESSALIASTRSLASPKSIWVFSRKNSGFCTPA